MTDDRLLPIGELSRASGLTVSALRFYDREGVLVPAAVDPATGYRRYATAQVHSARLLAGMRRVGMPLAEMTAVLECLPDTTAAQDLLSAHLHRLEVGLADARREVHRLTGLLAGTRSASARISVGADQLASALDGVRYAAATDPDYPMLCAVLLEPHEQGLRLVATDRYRLAVAEVEDAPGSSPEAPAGLLPTALVDDLRRALWEVPTGTSPAMVDLQVSPTRFSAQLPGGVLVAGDCLDLDFPDYRRLLAPGTPPTGAVQVPVADILTGLSKHLDEQVGMGPAGISDSGALVLDRAFLWEAASTLGQGYAVLPAEGEIAPLVLHDPDDRLVSLLMPIRATAP